MSESCHCDNDPGCPYCNLEDANLALEEYNDVVCQIRNLVDQYRERLDDDFLYKIGRLLNELG